MEYQFVLGSIHDSYRNNTLKEKKYCSQCKDYVYNKMYHDVQLGKCIFLEDDIKWCGKCNTNVYKKTSHCSECNKCEVNLKHHCNKCNKCVYNNCEHCDLCKSCTLKGSKHCKFCNYCHNKSHYRDRRIHHIHKYLKAINPELITTNGNISNYEEIKCKKCYNIYVTWNHECKCDEKWIHECKCTMKESLY